MANQMPKYPIFEVVDAPPSELDKWQTRIDLPQVNPDYGTFELVGMYKSPVEQQHRVWVIDEEDKPLYGVWVIFGYPGQTQPDLSWLKPAVNYWIGAPAVLAGDAQMTGFDGYAQHTTGPGGGEDCWIWYRVWDASQNRWELYLSSVIVRNMKSVPDINNHTCLELIFRRQMNLGNVRAY